MPVAPFVLTCKVLSSPHAACECSHHEKGEFSSCFGEDVGGVGKRNLVAIGICAIDVVETNGNLRHNLQPAFARFKQFGIHLVAQSGYQPIDTRPHFFKDQFLWGRFRLRIDFDLVTTFPQQIEGFPEIGGGKNTEFLAHDSLWLEFSRCSLARSSQSSDRHITLETYFESCRRGRSLGFKRLQPSKLS